MASSTELHVKVFISPPSKRRYGSDDALIGSSARSRPSRPVRFTVMIGWAGSNAGVGSAGDGGVPGNGVGVVVSCIGGRPCWGGTDVERLLSRNRLAHDLLPDEPH